jgi:hypothetical protein
MSPSVSVVSWWPPPLAGPAAPTFAEYIPVVSALVSDGCRKAYGSYWNRVVEQWGSRCIGEPTPSEIRQHVRASVVPRRNSRGGRSAAEHLIAALRCMYKHAEEDGLINPADNPARKVEKPRRLPSTRRAVADKRLAEINHAAATTGDDPELDTLLLRLQPSQRQAPPREESSAAAARSPRSGTTITLPAAGNLHNPEPGNPTPNTPVCAVVGVPELAHATVHQAGIRALLPTRADYAGWRGGRR